MTALIALFARSRVAANVLMAVIVVLGLVGVQDIRRATFPAFESDRARVSVVYPGATAADIEASVVDAIEERLADIEEIKILRSTSREGVGSVTAEFYEGSDTAAATQEIRDAVAAIATFPQDAEEPIITRVEPLDLVAFLELHGDAPEEVLREWAFDIEDRLIDEGVATQVTVDGARQREIHIEVDRRQLARLGIDLSAIAAAVRAASLDLPAGTLRSDHREILVRVASQRYRPDEYRDIPVLAASDGSVVTIGEIAEVNWRFEDQPLRKRYNGRPAITLSVLRSEQEDVLAIDERLDGFVARANGHGDQAGWLPAGLELTRTFAFADLVSERLGLLAENGLLGLVLVLCVLWFFTSWRISLWVAVGLFVAGLGTVFVLHATGRTIDMISMFALIMCLGILVDDAIIIAENIYHRHERGDAPDQAIVSGARQVTIPVFTATITTISAFLPLAMVPGRIGTFMTVLPVTVAIGLAVSLIEGFLILPHHLRNGLAVRDRVGERVHPLRARIDRGIQFTVERVIGPLGAWAVRWRYLVLAIALAACVLAIGLVAGKRVPFTFFPNPEGDILVTSVRFPVGTPIERTQAQIVAMEEALHEAVAGLEHEGERGLVRHVSTVIGGIPDPEGGLRSQGAHVGGMTVILLGSEFRDIPASRIAEAWRAELGDRRLPGLVTLTIDEMEGGPGGRDIEILISGRDWPALADSVQRIRAELAQLDGVVNIDDSYVLGKPEYHYRPSALGVALGIDERRLGETLRGQVRGLEAERFQRGRDEIITRAISAPEDRDHHHDLEAIEVRTPAGDLVPLPLAADRHVERRIDTIEHYQGRRVVAVTADIIPGVSNTGEVLAALGEPATTGEQRVLQQLRAEHGVEFVFEGVAENQRETFGGLRVGFAVSLCVIYLVLVLAFGSWLQPFTILVVIPVGLVGAVLGHLVLGISLTIISFFGLIGLMGIAVNDAITLIHFINSHRREGDDLGQAVVRAIQRRFRPIVMTTLTTVAGLLPLLLERSLQAQFLIPMATAISFGLLVATFGTLLVVPAAYLALHDFEAAFRLVVKGHSFDEHLERAHPEPATAPPSEGD